MRGDSNFGPTKASHALGTFGQAIQERCVTTTEEKVGCGNKPTRIGPICGMEGHNILTKLTAAGERGSKRVIGEDVTSVVVAAWSR